MSPFHCGQAMRHLPYGNLYFFTCDVMGDEFRCGECRMFCTCEKEMTKVNGIYECSCGKKETYCKAPFFSFNGVLDSDCGKCPGDFETKHELGGEG